MKSFFHCDHVGEVIRYRVQSFRPVDRFITIGVIKADHVLVFKGQD